MSDLDLMSESGQLDYKRAMSGGETKKEIESINLSKWVIEANLKEAGYDD